MHRSSLHCAGVKEGDPTRLHETTPIHNVFGGWFRNQVHCPGCGYDSNSYDSFLDLCLELSPAPGTGGGGGGGGSINSLDKALRRFTQPEVLDEKNKWKCPRCKKAVCARKQLTIRRPPAILTIQLKRFAFSPFGGMGMGMRGFGGGGGKHGKMAMMMAMMGGGMMGGSGRKLDHHVAFPDVLDITPALSDAAVAEVRTTLLLTPVASAGMRAHVCLCVCVCMLAWPWSSLMA